MSEHLDFDIVTTKNGDRGMTTLWSGESVSKADSLIELIGTIDELTSLLGAAKKKTRRRIRKQITQIQNTLYFIMSTLATSSTHENYQYVEPNDETVNINKLERDMKSIMKFTHIEMKFVIPNGWIHYARAVTRKVERQIVSYIQRTDKPINIEFQDLYIIQRYINRLSDYLFVIARRHGE